MISARAAGPLAVACLAAAGSLLFVPAAAHGDRTIVRDARGDGPRQGSTGPPARDHDIRKAIAAHAKGGKLRHIVRVTDASRWTLRDTFVEIRAGSAAYRISQRRVVRLQPGGIPGAHTGIVRGRRRGDRVVFVFKPEAIGAPRTYRWRAEAVLGMGRDLAPNRGFERHRLG